jgi:hypothetical protein
MKYVKKGTKTKEFTKPNPTTNPEILIFLREHPILSEARGPVTQ